MTSHVALLELETFEGAPPVPLLERAAYEAAGTLAGAAVALRRWRLRKLFIGVCAFLVLPIALVATLSLPEWFAGIAILWTLQGFWFTFKAVTSSSTGAMATLVFEKQRQLTDLKTRLTSARLGTAPPLSESQCRDLRGDLLAAYETGLLATAHGA